MSTIGDLGFFSLFLCCLLYGYSTLASVLSAMWRHRRLYRSAQYAITTSGALVILAAVCLWVALYQRDYSVEYVFKNSSNDLPALYTFTAFWSSLEGSHLLWSLLLAVFSVVAIWTYSRDNEHIMPFVSASLSAVLCWMFYLLISHSDPFVRVFPAHENGNGMNTLLQNPYMAIHPPMLFVGYTSLAIPAAYSVAALAFGDITEGWLKSTRRWALFAWCFLTAGVFLGGRWAYVELGWAGYWAWDPVENSSFIPWLFCTALLHSLIVQDKLGHLKRFTIILAFLGFFFSFFGTFITRSGIISSVHSFAESPIGPNYLMFLAGMLTIAVVLYGFKAHAILPSEIDKVWGISKESALVITQFLLLTLTVIVCVGTLYPIFSEWITNERTTVQAPYFNAFAPWIGLGLIVAIAIGNIMRYQSAKIPNLKFILSISAFVAIPMAMLFIGLGNVLKTTNSFNMGAQIVGIYLCFWSFGCLTVDLWFRVADLKFSLRLFFARNLAYFGAYVAHVGFLIAILGFLGNYRGVEKVTTLGAGESTELYGYDFTYKGMEVRKEENVQYFEAKIDIERNGQQYGEIIPARSKYPTKSDLLHEVGVHGSFWHDIYITVADFDEKQKRATFEMHINPTVRMVWLAAIIMVIGGAIAAFDRYRGNKSRDAIRMAA